MKINELEKQNESLQAQLTAQAAVIARMELLIKHYENQLLTAKRRMFGASSERTMIDGLQLSFLDPIEEAANPILELETEEITYNRKKRKGKREDDLAGLPVERINYELPEESRNCPECGESLKPSLKLPTTKKLHSKQAVLTAKKIV